MPKLSLFLIRIIKNRVRLGLFFLLVLINMSTYDCYCQISYTISKPQIKFSDDNLLITYDILGANPDDIFTIWLELTDVSGRKISAYALSGDVGENIKAGANKQIIWDIKADEVDIDDINVEIIAERIVRLATQSDKPEVVSNETDPPFVKVKIGKPLLQSVIFPGWGLTSLSNGKPYWLIGVAGYGCIASSVYYNQKSHASYDDYLNSSDNDITGYYDDAKRQGNVSKALAISAVVIWIVDLGLVSYKVNSINKSFKNSRISAFSINAYVDANTDSPMFIITYKF